jgi:hypothetical protein
MKRFLEKNDRLCKSDTGTSPQITYLPVNDALAQQPQRFFKPSMLTDDKPQDSRPPKKIDTYPVGGSFVPSHPLSSLSLRCLDDVSISLFKTTSLSRPSFHTFVNLAMCRRLLQCKILSRAKQDPVVWKSCCHFNRANPITSNHAAERIT